MTDSLTKPAATDGSGRPADADALDLGAAADLSTAPRQPTGPDRAGSSARRLWRQLTSMRTALQLLFLLALAAVPGSLLPQRGDNEGGVQQFFDQHKTLAPILDKLSFFNVFGSPWFAAVYLLLFISLIGCLTPRIRLHVRALRKPPPAAPKHFRRLPQSTSWTTDATPDAALGAARRRLRAGRWRVAVRDGAVSAEKGYLRETGNLAFHVALVVLLAAVALGGLWGYKGDVLLVEGQGFSNTPLAYDTLSPGRLFSPDRMTPFSFTLNRFAAAYDPNGQAKSFDAYIGWQPSPTSAARRYDVRENHPLVVDPQWFTGGLKLYLAGHGYAPHFVVRQPDGKVVFNQDVPFLPTNSNTYQSDGVVKVPLAAPYQIAFQGFFTPTTVATPTGLQSSFPGPRNPQVTLTAYHGLIRPTASIYTLDTTGMTQYAEGSHVASRSLKPGQTWKLPDGASITFTGLKQFADFHINYDPGKRLALVAAVFIVAGLLLSLRVRRRRVWVRATPLDGAVPGAPGGGRTLIEAGGLARSDAERFGEEFTGLAARLRATLPASAAPPDPAAPPRQTREE